MTDYTLKNLREDVEDLAPTHGMDGVEARFADSALELQKTGMSLQRLDPGVRQPFGHKHGQQEEIYVITGGAGRVKLDDEIIDVTKWDALRVPGQTMRALEGGDEGLEYVVFGAPRSPDDSPGTDTEMVPGWWAD